MCAHGPHGRHFAEARVPVATAQAKPAVSPELARERVDFAKRVLRLSRAALREKLSLSLDGVVLSMPPEDVTDRRNYCFNGVTHMYRRQDEAA